MAFKEKQILTCFLFIWLKVSGFVVFNEEKSLDSAGSFNKNARTRESFDQGDEKPKSGAQAGRLLIWQDQASKAHGGGGGGGSVSLSSDLSSHRLDENAYQSDDSGWMKLQPLWGQVYGLNTLYTPTVERLLGMRPKVDCVGDLMKLTVHGPEAPFGSNFLIDRGSIPPLPLSQLPSECGHRFLRTWRDFVFVIPYDGCYVAHERDTFVLSLLWWGLPVKVSCSSPTSVKSAPTVSCYTNGMIVRLHRGVSENLKIKVMNEWQPLLKVSARCGYSLVSHPEGVVIHAPYMPCTEPKDGMFTLSMAMESEFNLSCPALSLSLPVSAPARENGALPSIPDALVSTTLPPTTTTTTTTTTKTTQPSTTSSTSTSQKLPTPPHPYYIPGQPDFKPLPPSYPFVLFPPNIPPTIVPQGPKIVGPPAAITQRPLPPVYTQRPQIWYPWYPKPSFGPIPDPGKSAAVPYPRKPLLPPTKAPTVLVPPIAPLLKPTGIPQEKLTSTTHIVPPVQWAPMFPPRNLVYPLGPGKPGLAAPSSAGIPQVPYLVHQSQTQPRPPEAYAPPKPEPEPPAPAPTIKTGPQLLRYPWYKPFPPRRSEMPPVPTKVPQSTTVSTSAAVACCSTKHLEEPEQDVKPQVSVVPYPSAIKGPPARLHFDFPPITYSTPSPPKFPEVVHTPAEIQAPVIPISSSHAHSFHCPIFCPGPPSVFYHQHNHHHFGHPLQISNLDISSMTKITGQTLSSPIISPGSTRFPLIQGMGYNYAPLYSKGTAVPPSSDRSAMQYLVENPLIKDTDAPDASKHLIGPTMCPYFFRKLESPADSPQSRMKPADVAPIISPSKLHSRPLQNRPVAEPLAYSDQSPDPVVNQAEIQQYFSPWGHDAQPMLVAPNNIPSFEKLVQHDIALKPTMPPTHGKNVFMNYWYQAANSNAKLPMSDSPTRDSFTPMPSNNRNPSELSNGSPQAEQTRGENPPLQLNFHPLMQISESVPVMNPQLYFPPNGESVVPVFRGSKLFETHWVPAVQSNTDALLSSSQADGYMRHPSTVG